MVPPLLFDSPERGGTASFVVDAVVGVVGVLFGSTWLAVVVVVVVVVVVGGGGGGGGGEGVVVLVLAFVVDIVVCVDGTVVGLSTHVMVKSSS